jgi:hypothetical protein
MLAAALRIELRFPNAHSLKEKRSLLKPMVEGLRLRASVAEVGFHDAWQRSTVGVALVAGDGARLDHLIEEVRRYVESHLEVEMLEMAVAYVEEPG